MEQESHSFGLVDYCQYLLSSQKNFTITNLANHLQTVSHDLINSFLRNVEVTPEQGEKFKLVRPRDFPTHKQVNVSTNNTEYIITDDPDSLNPEEVKEEYSKRWQVEVFYRELKQTTRGSKAQIQRNHIGCALLVWVKLKEFANICKTSVYAIKQQIMSHWLSWELKYPLFAMSLV